MHRRRHPDARRDGHCGGRHQRACESGSDRPKPSDPFVARIADPVPLSIQGVKRTGATKARTPKDRRRGDRCGVYADDCVDRVQFVVLRLRGLCAAPRNSGGNRAPIGRPASGAVLLHCRENCSLLFGGPGTCFLLHGGGSLPGGLITSGCNPCQLVGAGLRICVIASTSSHSQTLPGTA